MPKVTINEIDSSRYVAPSADAPMTVLVPGTASFGPTFDSIDPRTSVFTGESGLSSFFNLYGFGPAILDETSDTLPGDLSYEYVTNLLRSGAQVLYYRLNEGSAANTGDDANTLITAKYGGKFGNTIAVSVTATSPTDTSCVLGIYSFPSEFSKATEIKPSDLLRQDVSRLYYSRVSIDPTSQYYIGTNDNGFVTIEPSVLKNLIATTTSDSTTAIKNLFGGKDFTSEDITTTTSDGDIKINSSALAKKLEDSYASFVDPYLFEFDFVTSGGLIEITDESSASETLVPLSKSMLDLAKTRGDCLAILDYYQDWSAEDTLLFAGINQNDSSYGAIYAPWCSFVSTTTGKTQMMPPSIIFLKARLLGMQSQAQSELWYVPAGVARTSAPFIVDTKYEIGSTILDEFQNNYDYRVNPIMRLRNYGYCVYGNATTLRSVPGLPHSALESLNVRLISNVIKKDIFNICCGLSFEYNNSDLWLKFYSQMDERLLYMKRNYGLYDYRIEMGLSTVTDAALNERRVPGKVIISPTLAGEYFDIDFEIMPSGVSFAEEEE